MPSGNKECSGSKKMITRLGNAARSPATSRKTCKVRASNNNGCVCINNKVVGKKGGYELLMESDCMCIYIKQGRNRLAVVKACKPQNLNV
jgi:hypothetical protein